MISYQNNKYLSSQFDWNASDLTQGVNTSARNVKGIDDSLSLKSVLRAFKLETYSTDVIKN